jgi:outer membrane protein assembly factor BamD
LDRCGETMDMMRRSLTVLLAFTFALTFVVSLGGCTAFGEKEDETKNWSAQRLFTEGKQEIGNGNYERAVKLFETLEARYPFGRYAQQAQLELAYAYYRDDEPAQAIAAADRFIKLHPNHPNVDYAYYIRGLANFQGDLGLFSFLSNQDLSDRDPKAMRDSFDAFKDLVTRYPNSKYTKDATERMGYITNALASHEVHVARYYYKRGAYVAAVNRAQSALENYPRMGMQDLRADTERVFKLNYPKSPYVTGNFDKAPWWQFWKDDKRVYN